MRISTSGTPSTRGLGRSPGPLTPDKGQFVSTDKIDSISIYAMGGCVGEATVETGVGRTVE
jgi:hypothetical protein